WLAVTLPETYLVALSLGLYGLLVKADDLLRSHERLAALGLLCFAIVFPLGIVMLGKSVVYDAHRHVLFVLPLIAALTGWLVAEALPLLRRRTLQLATCATLLFLAGLTAIDMARLHPYEYVFINRSFGGLPAARDYLETEYWGASYREGLAWLLEDLKDKHARRARVSWCTRWIPLRYYLSQWPGAADQIELADAGAPADYYLSRTASSCRRREGEVVYTVSREGVPFLQVVKSPPVARAERAARAGQTTH
ncbi:MAG: hypothetical protein ABW321_27865, partial [Polyangiales bacterium]